MAVCCLQPKWVTILGPYLMESAQVLWKTLPIQDLGDYDHIKAAILDCYEITPKTQWQRFHYKVGDRPKTLITELRQCAMRWLLPTTQGEPNIVDKVILQQVCYAMPPAICKWLIRLGSTTLDPTVVCHENCLGRKGQHEGQLVHAWEDEPLAQNK